MSDGRGHKKRHQWRRNIARMERELARLPENQRKALQAKIENSKVGLVEWEKTWQARQKALNPMRRLSWQN